MISNSLHLNNSLNLGSSSNYGHSSPSSITLPKRLCGHLLMMDNSEIKTIRPLVHDDKIKKIQRYIIVTEGYGFYKSSGESSCLAGIFLPFTYIQENGKIEKPDFAQFSYESKSMFSSEDATKATYWFGELDDITILISKNKHLARFGNLEAMLISYALDETAWKKNPILKNLISIINNCPRYHNFINQIRSQIKIDSIHIPCENYYDSNNPAKMKELYQYLTKDLSLRYNNGGPISRCLDRESDAPMDDLQEENLFPPYSDAMEIRIASSSAMQDKKESDPIKNGISSSRKM